LNLSWWSLVCIWDRRC